MQFSQPVDLFGPSAFRGRRLGYFAPKFAQRPQGIMFPFWAQHLAVSARFSLLDATINSSKVVVSTSTSFGSIMLLR